MPPDDVNDQMDDAERTGRRTAIGIIILMVLGLLALGFVAAVKAQVPAVALSSLGFGTIPAIRMTWQSVPGVVRSITLPPSLKRIAGPAAA